MIAGRRRACHEDGMARDHEQPAPPRTLTDEESASPIEPAQFLLRDDGQGGQTLDIVEGTFEQSYRLGDSYTTKLFVDLARSRGLLPYRHRRQHAGTICVRASLSEHNALWSHFLELSRQLGAQLHELTCAFVKARIPPAQNG